MAGIEHLNDVSSAILDMDTLAMDSMDIHLDASPNVGAPAVLIGAQSKGTMSTGSHGSEKAQQESDDVHEIEDPVGTGVQESGLKETNNDNDEGLMTDPGTPDTPCTPQEVASDDDHELAETNDIAENGLETETGYDDEGLMTDPGTPDTPGTPEEEFLPDAQDLGETEDMNLEETENHLEEERDSDDEDSNPGSPQDEPLEDANEPDEMKDMNADKPEHDAEVLGDGEEARENPLDGEKFVAPFPVSRVKRIIKLDKDVRLVTSDAIALIAQATGLFIQSLSSASFTVMLRTKRKTIRGPDVVLAAKSTRQFRECLGNDLATLLGGSNGDTANGEAGPIEKEQGISDELVRTRPQQQKSAKKHQLAAPPGSRPITNFFKA